MLPLQATLRCIPLVVLPRLRMILRTTGLMPRLRVSMERMGVRIPQVRLRKILITTGLLPRLRLRRSLRRWPGAWWYDVRTWCRFADVAGIARCASNAHGLLPTPFRVALVRSLLMFLCAPMACIVDVYARRKMSAMVRFPIHQPFISVQGLFFQTQVWATRTSLSLRGEFEFLLCR